MQRSIEQLNSSAVGGSGIAADINSSSSSSSSSISSSSSSSSSNNSSSNNSNSSSLFTGVYRAVIIFDIYLKLKCNQR